MHKKYIKTSSFILISGMLIFNSSMTYASALSKQESNNSVLTTQVDLNDKNRSAPAIDNIDTDVANLLKSANYGKSLAFRYGIPYWDPSISVKGENIESTNITEVVPIFVGGNKFTNNGPLEQTYSTSSYSKTVEKATSTTTTHGFVSSVEAGGKVGIPFVAEGEVKAKLEYNFSSANTNSYSESETITAEPQNVRVPAGKTYECKVYFNKLKTTGEIKLMADIKNDVAFLNPDFTPKRCNLTDLYNEAIKLGQPTYDFSLSSDDKTAVRKLGSGEFSVEYGSELVVEINDITDQKSPKLVKRTTIDLDNKDYF